MPCASRPIPSALAARQIGIDTLANAVAAANVNLATGALNGTTQSTDHPYRRPAQQCRRVPQPDHRLPQRRAGAPRRCRHVHRQRWKIPTAGSWYKDKRAIVLAISRQPGSNTIEVVDAIKAILPQFQAQPAALASSWTSMYDRSQIIRASIDDVQTTLLIAGVLVVGVIFVFLRRVSATIIPSLALPIAVIGTFAGMALFGYNLDNLSLMALTLSVGFVVDDAIVMLENIVRHIEDGEKPYEAALKGSAEIGFTILSMTVRWPRCSFPSSSWAASSAGCCTNSPSPSSWRSCSPASFR